MMNNVVFFCLVLTVRSLCEGLIPNVRSVDALSNLNSWLSKELITFEKVNVAELSEENWGLICNRKLNRGDVVLEIPMKKCLSASSVRLGKCGEALGQAESGDEEFEPLCGDVTLLAMQLLCLESEWTQCLTYPSTLPLLSEIDDQILERFSSRALGVLRANANDDYDWLIQNKFFDRISKPQNAKEWQRYIAVALSRSFFIDDELILAPGLDFVNHDDLLDIDTIETCIQKRRTLRGDIKIAVTAPENLDIGMPFTLSYGALPAASYLENFGFLPSKSAARRASAAVEIRFELDPQDRFLDDKRDIYQSNSEKNGEQPLLDDGLDFCLVGSEPDPDYLRFARLKFLGGTDAFLLEPIFAKEIWDFLDLPISRENEFAALTALADECRAIRDALSSDDDEEAKTSSTSVNEQKDDDATFLPLLSQLRNIELTALENTLNWIDVEINSLDTKEYYQERRLKELGLDTEWCAEDQGAQWSGTRTPGGVDW